MDRLTALGRAALRRDTAGYANHARHHVNNAALGEPKGLLSQDRGVVIAPQAVSMRHRLP